jgi:proliferating cell nuclear antigen
MLNVTARLDLMSKILDTLKAVVEDAKFDFKENSLHIRVVDHSHVAMIQMDIDSAAFDTWELDESSVAFELGVIRDIVGIGSPDEMLNLKTDSGSGMLHAKLGNVKGDIRTIDPSTITVPSLPPLKPQCKVHLSGKDFIRILRAAKLGGDMMTLAVKDNEFIVTASGPSNSIQVFFEKDDLQLLEFDQPAHSQYSIGYLHPLNKVVGDVDTLEIGFGENYPLSINFTFYNGAVEVQYFLAPRVEGDI